MKNKLLLAIISLLPLISQANTVDLDGLVNNDHNFCDQGRNGEFVGVLKFFQLNKNSLLKFKGFNVTHIEIAIPDVVLSYDDSKLKEESKKYVKEFDKNYNFKNLYSITLNINFIVNSDPQSVKTALGNFNQNRGGFYNKFGNYNPSVLNNSTSMQDFENNMKQIQVPEYNAMIVPLYQNNLVNSNFIYQCKLVSYTKQDADSIKNQLSQ